MEQKCELAHAAVLARQRIQMRLQDLFMTLSSEQPSPLYTLHFPNEKQESLVIRFDNGIDPNPAYSGTVTGKLYLDEEHQLCLALWPLDKSENPYWRKEVLASHIKNFSFQFLGLKKKSTGLALNTAYAWHPRWELERATEIPSQIRLFLYEMDGTLLQFAFCLATAEPVATYGERK